MTELMEPASVAKLNHADHDEQTCAFCTAPQTPTSEENDLTDHFDEDANETPGLNDEGMAHKNNAGKLGQDLEKNGYTQIATDVTVASKTLPVQSAAHHILPGNATLKKSDIMDYLHTDKMATGNIGYNVNNYENGVWLVGNYGLRGKKGLPRWGSKGSDFTKDTKGIAPYQYVKAAIEATGCQFHDAHPEYSKRVIQVLDLVAEKFEMTRDVWCEEAADKPDKPEDQQLFMLVNRLNTISRRLNTMLNNPGKNWKKNVYTSDFSRMYINSEIYK